MIYLQIAGFRSGESGLREVAAVLRMSHPAREPLRCPDDGSRLVEVEHSEILIEELLDFD